MKPPMAHKIKIDRPWTSAAATDISKTFARVRKEINAARHADPLGRGDASANTGFDSRQRAVSAPIYLRRKA